MQTIQKWPTGNYSNSTESAPDAGEGEGEGAGAAADSEDEKRHAKKMQALGRLASGVAHDFNNLLTVIGGYANLLLDRLGDSSDIRQELLHIVKASDRAAAFTRQLLTFGSKQPSRVEIVNLSDLASEHARMLRPLVGEDIELVTKLARDLPGVRAHPGHILEILLNLATNARDAMPNGGCLVFETAVKDDPRVSQAGPADTHSDDTPLPISLTGEWRERLKSTHVEEDAARAKLPWVVLTVSDTGRGMDAREKARIFEPFFTTKPPGRGTGLGLAMVAELVFQMGGRIQVETLPGRGTSFSLWFPSVVGDQTQETQVDENIDFPGGAETILLVEDAEDVRTLFERVLSNHGYRVLTASCGAEAIAAAASTPVDLLITDVVMPRMDGPMVAQQIAATQPKMRVMYVSGYSPAILERIGRSSNEVSFLQKPLLPEVLLFKIREVLSEA